MPLYNPPNLTTGIDDAIIDTAGAVDVFIPMLLLFVFGVVFIGGSMSQKRRLGIVDFPMWAALSSISTLCISLLLSLVSGGIQMETITIVTTLTIFSGFWLFMDRNRNEI